MIDLRSVRIALPLTTMYSNPRLSRSFTAVMMPMRRLFLVLLTLMLNSAPAQPQPPNSEDQRDIARQRQDIIDAILTSDRPESVASIRWVCMSGDEPGSVREARAGGGFDFTPDAFDSCLAALWRKGKDHALLEAYKKLAVTLQGNPDNSDRLPRAIGASVLSGDGKVSIGNGKGIVVDAALAFDAGFTVAYMNAAPKKESDLPKVKAFAELCLDQKKDAATCFSVGYTLGTQAVNAR